jgi:hypothetical protein
MKPFENYECEGQINIFDYMESLEAAVQQDTTKIVQKSKKAASGCKNKDNCKWYPYSCKGVVFWCQLNKELKLDNCLNCRLYKIECFPEHSTAHGSCLKYKVVPDWYPVHRCQTCMNWSCNTEQPPAGWGIYGFCSLHKEKTSHCSDCCENDFEGEN